MIMIVIQNYTRRNYGDNITVTVEEFLRDSEVGYIATYIRMIVTFI